MSVTNARLALSLLGLAVLAAATLTITLISNRQPASSASVTIPLTRANALIQATTGERANALQAVGDQAKVINAALPFNGGALHAAQPFAAAGNDVDQRRALLC